MNEASRHAKILWDFNLVNQKLEKADYIVALGNSDIRTVHAAVTLLKQGYANILITTGGFGRLTKDMFVKPEAEVFAEEAIRLGVSEKSILIENNSSNTFDNIRFTKKLLDKEGLLVRNLIVVTKPYMERRALATARAVLPDVRISVSSPDLDFYSYPNEFISTDLLINMIVGDTQRLMIFSEHGNISEQEFPKEVVDAYVSLLKLGYDKQVVLTQNIPNLLNAVGQSARNT